MNNQTNTILQKISEVRASNNTLWMRLLQIALEKAPDETKEVLSKIRENDLVVSSLTGLLAGEGQYGDMRS